MPLISIIQGVNDTWICVSGNDYAAFTNLEDAIEYVRNYFGMYEASRPTDVGETSHDE